jgi:hypothetical protein
VNHCQHWAGEHHGNMLASACFESYLGTDYPEWALSSALSQWLIQHSKIVRQFSWWGRFMLWLFGLWCCVVMWWDTTILEGHASSIFRVKWMASGRGYNYRLGVWDKVESAWANRKWGRTVIWSVKEWGSVPDQGTRGRNRPDKVSSPLLTRTDLDGGPFKGLLAVDHREMMC